MPNLAIYPSVVAYPAGMVGTQSRLFFFSENYAEATSSLALWSVDQATGKAVQVTTFSGPENRSGQQMAFGERILFSIDNDTSGGELWISDGTNAGTQRLYAYNSNRYGSRSEPRALTAAGNSAYFFAESPQGSSLWKTDGTAAGTQQVKAVGSAYGDIVAINGNVYFQAGGELWKSDGTEAGTAVLRTSEAGWIEDELWELNGRLLFKQSKSQNQYSSSDYELWSTDGSSQGAVRVSTSAPVETSYGSEPRAMGGKLYFAASDASAGVELWSTDGTQAGTSRVKDINPGAAGSDLNSIETEGPYVYFQASDGDSTSAGYDLWRTDGTEAGTIKLFERPYWQSIYPTSTKGFEGKLYFSGDEYGRNRNYISRLWVSDGSVAGTQPLIQDDTKATISQPGSFTRVGNALFFMGSDGAARRLYRLDHLPPTGEVRINSQVPTSPASSNHPFGFEGVLTGISNAKDMVTGTSSNDILGSGIGPDELTGGPGADIFAFYNADRFDAKGADRINDFNPNEGDRIWLSPLALPGLSLIQLNVATSKKAFKKALKSEDSLIYDLRSGAVFFNENGRGKGLGSGGLLTILTGSPSVGDDAFKLFG